jgi:hypothetical protein
MRITILAILSLSLLTACGEDYTPRSKQAVYDPTENRIVPPYPCPDWSHSAQVNYDNSLHSNFGCATQNNLSVQLENPADWKGGHGTSGPDAETTIRVIEQYRAGDLPRPLTPQQDTQQ